MDIQRLQWKFYLPENLELAPKVFFEIFNDWIIDSSQVFMDVADYKHVTDGPLIALVGHYADVFIDNSQGKLGFVYAYKRGLEGSLAERLTKVYQEGKELFEKLQNDSRLKAKISIADAEIIFNDRAFLTNDEASFKKVENDIKQCLIKIKSGKEPNYSRLPLDPRCKLTIQVTH